MTLMTEIYILNPLTPSPQCTLKVTFDVNVQLSFFHASLYIFYITKYARVVNSLAGTLIIMPIPVISSSGWGRRYAKMSFSSSWVVINHVKQETFMFVPNSHECHKQC